MALVAVASSGCYIAAAAFGALGGCLSFPDAHLGHDETSVRERLNGLYHVLHDSPYAALFGAVGVVLDQVG